MQKAVAKGEVERDRLPHSTYAGLLLRISGPMTRPSFEMRSQHFVWADPFDVCLPQVNVWCKRCRSVVKTKPVLPHFLSSPYGQWPTVVRGRNAENGH